MNKQNKKLLKTALEMVQAQNEVILSSLADEAKAEEVEQERKASDIVDNKIKTWKEEKTNFGFNPK